MYYGFDVGGTKIEFGAFDLDLIRIATERVATPADDYSALVNSIVSLVEKYDQQFGSEGTIGIGFPGVENADDESVLTVNIPCANGKPLRHDLEKRLNRPVKLENDANCFALSEATDDALRNSPSVMGLILGTGFGGGLIYNGKVFSGRNHVAGELGHMRVPVDAWMLLGDNPPYLQCGCGKRGCLDNYLSGRGLELLYSHQHNEQRKAIDIIQSYKSGEAIASAFIDQYLEFLAACFGNLFTGNDPHVVVLGGGLSNFDDLYEELPKRIPKYLLPIAKCPQILKAKYGDSGGVRGAAFLNL
jgi:N-acetylglucosamine kinase